MRNRGKSMGFRQPAQIVKKLTGGDWLFLFRQYSQICGESPQKAERCFKPGISCFTNHSNSFSRDWAWQRRGFFLFFGLVPHLLLSYATVCIHFRVFLPH